MRVFFFFFVRVLIVLVSGMGFGLVQAIFSYTNVLKEASGPGVVGLASKGDEYFFLNSGKSCKNLLLELFFFFFFNF